MALHPVSLRLSHLVLALVIMHPSPTGQGSESPLWSVLGAQL